MKFENTQVFNFDGAIRGMRFPLQSNNKSDSYFNNDEEFVLGWADLDLAKRLIRAGKSHCKFLRQIFVSVDLTLPIYIWTELDQYKIATVTNSESKMHTLYKTPITRDCFEMDDYDGRLGLIDPQILDVRIGQWINDLEQLRQMYLNTKDKRYWKELIRWLPESWLQTRTWTANYEVLRNIYFQRRNHKLTEWHTFCEWIKTLPYAEELIIYEGEKG